eukprot:6125_1
MNCLRHFSVCKPVVVTDIVLQPRHPVDVGGVRERGGGRCSGPEGSDRCDVGRDESRRSWADLDFGEKLHPAAQSGSPHTAAPSRPVWEAATATFAPLRAVSGGAAGACASGEARARGAAGLRRSGVRPGPRRTGRTGGSGEGSSTGIEWRAPGFRSTSVRWAPTSVGTLSRPD